MKKLFLGLLFIVFAASGLSAFTAADLDRVEETVTTAGAAFNNDIPFSRILYKGEWFSVSEMVTPVSGNTNSWYSMLEVNDDETGNTWFGSYHYYVTQTGAGQYTAVSKFVIIYQVSE